MSVIGYGWRKLLSPLFRLFGSHQGLSFGRGLIIYGLPKINVCSGSSVRIGSGVVLCSKSNFTALGVSKPVIIRAISPGAVVTIGDYSGFSGTTIVAAQEITIGGECLIGADVMICDNDFHPINPERRRLTTTGIKSSPVVIGKNVFIGARSIILKGTRIGDNSVIGAGSVVVGNIPSDVIAAGNPARVIRSLRVGGGTATGDFLSGGER